jgi:hypothetical protein
MLAMDRPCGGATVSDCAFLWRMHVSHSVHSLRPPACIPPPQLVSALGLRWLSPASTGHATGTCSRVVLSLSTCTAA